MVLQAFFDDSYERDGQFVLAGYIAPAELWADFSAEWESYLRAGWGLTKRDKNTGEPIRYFKMAEMASTPERMERVGAFFRIIEKYELLAVSININELDLKRAVDRLWSPQEPLDFSPFDKPFMMAYWCLTHGLHHQREALHPFVKPGDKINVIFDAQLHQDEIIKKNWDDYISTRKEYGLEIIGDMPCFESDDQYLPLQAADLWAWWVRKWSEGRDINQTMNVTFDRFRVSPKLKIVAMGQDEDGLADNLKGTMLRPGQATPIIYDRKFDCL